MRIGIITLNGFFNYGNRLQNYALHTFLKNIVDDLSVETIWYTDDNYEINKKIVSIKNIRRYVFNRHGFRKFIDSGQFVNECFRQYNIKNFSEKYISTVYDYKIKKDLNNKYDYFIVGSDQIWNPCFVDCKNEFLQFAEKYKRIAYSASIGLSNINDIPRKKVNEFKNGVLGMNHISVREEAGAKIIKELTGMDVPVLVDPTLLLTKEEWSSIITRPVWYKDEKYILLFFLSKVPDKVECIVNNLAIEKWYKIINLMDPSNLDYYASSPDEFLYLIKNASLVYTDSFHGTVFSIIMRVPFVNCPRENVGINMNSRIDTLLKLVDLNDRKGYKGNGYKIDNLFEIKYGGIDRVLNEERERSKMYLLKALDIHK